MKGTTNIYNTEPLLFEIENVIKNGLDKILSKTLERYELLERTHKQLMLLPSIRQELGKDSESDSESDSISVSESTPNIDSIPILNNTYYVEVKSNILNVESKLDRLEMKYSGLYSMLDKILDKIET